MTKYIHILDLTVILSSLGNPKTKELLVKQLVFFKDLIKSHPVQVKKLDRVLRKLESLELEPVSMQLVLNNLTSIGNEAVLDSNLYPCKLFKVTY